MPARVDTLSNKLAVASDHSQQKFSNMEDWVKRFQVSLALKEEQARSRCCASCHFELVAYVWIKMPMEQKFVFLLLNIKNKLFDDIALPTKLMSLKSLLLHSKMGVPENCQEKWIW